MILIDKQPEAQAPSRVRRRDTARRLGRRAERAVLRVRLSLARAL